VIAYVLVGEDSPEGSLCAETDDEPKIERRTRDRQ
jgi:hypothetical protein